MKTSSLPLIVRGVGLLAAASLHAATTIDPVHPDAYGANIGWLNARGDTANGAVIGYAYCSGFVWSANCGWIGLGNGPTNGWQYGNAAAADWGVNHDGEGRLTGYAYGANIGWLTFEQTYGQPRVDLLTGDLSGFVWGANVGWIGLTNAWAHVRTAWLDGGPDSDADGIPDPVEFRHAGNLTALHDDPHDADEDGVSDVAEAGADTNPLDGADFLAITGFAAADGLNTLEWRARPTRLYRVEATNALPATPGTQWTDVGGGLIGPPATPTETVEIADEDEPQRFYRVQAVMPLDGTP